MVRLGKWPAKAEGPATRAVAGSAAEGTPVRRGLPGSLRADAPLFPFVCSVVVVVVVVVVLSRPVRLATREFRLLHFEVYSLAPDGQGGRGAFVERCRNVRSEWSSFYLHVGLKFSG